MRIDWTETSNGVEGTGPSGHSYLLKPAEHPSGDGGTAWLVFQDGAHGFTFQDRAMATLVAGQVEALTFGQEYGFEALDHMALLDALTMLNANMDEIEPEDEDEPFSLQLIEDRRRIEAQMAVRRISQPVCRVH